MSFFLVRMSFYVNENGKIWGVHVPKRQHIVGPGRHSRRTFSPTCIHITDSLGHCVSVEALPGQEFVLAISVAGGQPKYGSRCLNRKTIAWEGFEGRLKETFCAPEPVLFPGYDVAGGAGHLQPSFVCVAQPGDTIIFVGPECTPHVSVNPMELALRRVELGLNDMLTLLGK